MVGYMASQRKGCLTMSRRVRVVISLVILLFAFIVLVACTVSFGPGSGPAADPAADLAGLAAAAASHSAPPPPPGRAARPQEPSSGCPKGHRLPPELAEVLNRWAR